MDVSNKLIALFSRYFLLILLALNNLFIFYLVLTPLTIYVSYVLTSVFANDASLQGNVMLVNGFYIEIVEACVAGAAYYFLLMLNLATPKIKLKKRIIALIFSFMTLFIFNIVRILIMTYLIINNYNLFLITHMFFWYFLSIIFVVLIWFLTVKTFEIKSIPFYSDIQFIKNLSKKK